MASSTTATANNSPTNPSSSSTAASPTTPSPDAQREAHAAVLATLTSAGSAQSPAYQSRIRDLHANTAVIARQESEVKASAQALAKESAKWEREVGKATEGLKGFGDLQNWAEVMEREFCILEETVRLVEGGRGVDEEQRSGSGGSTWRR